jgi:hypothetical protein
MSDRYLKLPQSCDNCVDTRSFKIPQQFTGNHWWFVWVTGLFATLAFMCGGIGFMGNTETTTSVVFFSIFAFAALIPILLFVRVFWSYLRGRRVWVYRDKDGYLHTHLPKTVGPNKKGSVLVVRLGLGGYGTGFLQDKRHLPYISRVNQRGIVTAHYSTDTGYDGLRSVEIKQCITNLFDSIQKSQRMFDRVLGEPSNEVYDLRALRRECKQLGIELLRKKHGSYPENVGLEHLLYGLCEIEFLAKANAAAGKSQHVRSMRAAIEALVGAQFDPEQVKAMRKRVAQVHQDDRDGYGNYVDKCGNPQCVGGRDAIMRRRMSKQSGYQCIYCGFVRTNEEIIGDQEEGKIKIA